MKRLVKHKENLFGMSTIRSKNAIPEAKKLIPQFIYISSVDGNHGPRLKFSGGSSETDRSKTAPTMAFDNNGDCSLVLQKWMNKSNCPNAFDASVISGLKRFVKTFLPVLLLTWYERIDEGIAVEYMIAVSDLREIVEQVSDATNIRNLIDLDSYCRQNGLYSFEQ